MNSRNYSSNSMLEHALQYQKLGWCVIPLQPKGKKPLIDWKDYQTRQASESEINEWWTRWPDANIGIVTGRVSGFYAVDVDGELGAESARDLKLSASVINLTGRGSHHLYKLNGTPIKTGAGLRPGIDVRGDGGYIVAPPSTHPTGKAYEWEYMSDPFNTQLMEPPESVLEALKHGQPITVRDEILQWHELFKGVGEGTRNDTLTRLAGRLISKGLSEPETIEILKLQNSKNIPPLPDKEVQSICRSIWDKDKAGKPTLPDKWVIDGTEFLSAEIELQKWLIDDIWTDEACGFIGAEPKTGKTWMALDMAIGIVTGKPVFGKFQAAIRGSVLYIAEEGRSQDLQRRISKLAHSKGIGKEELYPLRLSIHNGVKIDDEAWKQKLSDECAHSNFKAIFIDPFFEVHSKSEDRAEDMRPILSFLRDLRNKYHCAVILIHHQRKPREDDRSRMGQKLRGSGALYGWLDSAIYLEKPKGEDTISVQVEHREAESIEPFLLNLNSNNDEATLEHREGSLEGLKMLEMAGKIEKLITSRVDGVLQKEIDAKIGGRVQSRHDALKKLEELDKIEKRSEKRPDTNGKMRSQTVWYAKGQPTSQISGSTREVACPVTSPQPTSHPL